MAFTLDLAFSSVRTLQSVLPHFRLFLCTLACPSTVVSAAQPGLACSAFQFLQMGPDILCGHLREVAREGERREREAIMEHCFPLPPLLGPICIQCILPSSLPLSSSLFPRRFFRDESATLRIFLPTEQEHYIACACAPRYD